MDRIALQEIIEAMQLVNLTPELALDDVFVDSTEVNRPALQLAGYYDYFDEHRIQIIGKVEYSYVSTMPEEKALKARREANHRKGDSITRYIQNSLAGEKFKTAKCAVSYRKSETVEFTDQDLVPDEYWRVKTTREPDKTALKTALKAGESIPGAYLEQHQNMSIK